LQKCRGLADPITPASLSYVSHTDEIAPRVSAEALKVWQAVTMPQIAAKATLDYHG
jgi:hypothetical protein